MKKIQILLMTLIVFLLSSCGGGGLIKNINENKNLNVNKKIVVNKKIKVKKKAVIDKKIVVNKKLKIKKKAVIDKKIVVDNKTGLMWKKCSEGQILKNNICSGKAKQYEWQEAFDYAKTVNFAGYSDWRLPTVQELNTLVYCPNGYQMKYIKDNRYNDSICYKANTNDYQKPIINSSLFLNKPIAEGLFSSSLGENDLDSVWMVYFFNGDDSSIINDINYHMRLVRTK